MKILYFVSLISMLIVSNSFAQSSKTSPKLFLEKVYLHTDRELYTGGEDLWFSAYLIDAQSNDFINTSNTLYVELNTSHGDKTEIVERKLVRLENGKGHGDFKLADSLTAGTYYLRAWTNWMRNFGDNFIFQKEIKIAGSDRSETKSAAMTISSKTAASPQLKERLKLEDLQFLPEGGSMVANIPGIVAFKAVDASGGGLGLSGKILNKNAETVAEFSSKTGSGIFIFQPQEGEVYSARGEFQNGKKFEQPMEKALSSGFAIRVIDKDSVFNATISVNKKTNIAGTEVLLAAKSRGKVYFSVQFELKGSQSLIQIPKADLPEGITAITLYDQNGKPHLERLVYVEKQLKPSVAITTNKPVYKAKEKVVLNIKVANYDQNPVKTTLSLAAVDGDIIPANVSNIYSYLMLESELKGKIENPNQYFDIKNENRKKSLDLLLLTQGWRNFLWKRLTDSAVRITNVPEKGITISGKVRQILLDKPVAGASVSMFVNGAKGDKLFAESTDSAGNYHLDGLQIYGDQIIKLTTANSKGKKNGWIQMDSVFKTIPPKVSKSSIFMDTLYSKNLSEIAKRYYQNRKMNIKDTVRLNEVKVKLDESVRLFDMVARPFGYPDENFVVTKADYDYRDLRHYLLHKSKQLIEDSIRLVFPFHGKNHQPRFVINGRDFGDNINEDQQMIDDIAYSYYGLPMDKIERVTIKHLVGGKTLTVGEEITTSFADQTRDVFLIYLTLKPGALQNRKFNAIMEQVTGYNEARVFYKPLYDVYSSADARTTIYWNPVISTDERGESKITFTNSDIKSKVRIVIEGLHSTSGPFTETVYYEVR